VSAQTKQQQNRSDSMAVGGISPLSLRSRVKSITKVWKRVHISMSTV